MRRLSVVLVDDEPLARDGLRAGLTTLGGIQVVGEAASGEEAWTVVRAREPDAVFLDVEMPHASGIEVARRIRRTEGLDPDLVFVTAWDRYAVDAFGVEAVDYLVKPWDDARLGTVLERLQRRRVARNTVQEMGSGRSGTNERAGPITRLTVRSGDAIHFVDVDTVESFESSGNHVLIRRGSTIHRIRATLRWLEEVLNPAFFVRVHRSTILNVEGISEVRLLPSGDYEALLFNGRRVRVSRHYRDRLLRPGF